MLTSEYEFVRTAIERLAVYDQVWLLDRRVRVRRVTENVWKVIPHDARGKGDPLRFFPVKTTNEAVRIVVHVCGEIEAREL